jgi:hypothetical protein
MLMSNKKTVKLACNNETVKAWTKDNYKFVWLENLIWHT